MKMINLTTCLTAFALIFAVTGSPVMAHSSHDEGCEVSLNYDVTVEPQKLTFSESHQELYRVESGKLFVEGEEVVLNEAQHKLLGKYADEVSNQVPEVIEVVNDAVIIATQAVSIALTPMLGEESGANLANITDGIGKRVGKIAYQQGEKFYLGATEDAIEDSFNDEFSEELENLVQNSMGSIMMAIGREMMSGESGSFETKMEEFGARMENIGDEVEAQIEAQAGDLEQRADKLCENFERLLVIEEQLRNEIPELRQFPLANEDNYSSQM